MLSFDCGTGPKHTARIPGATATVCGMADGRSPLTNAMPHFPPGECGTIMARLRNGEYRGILLTPIMDSGPAGPSHNVNVMSAAEVAELGRMLTQLARKLENAAASASEAVRAEVDELEELWRLQ